MYTHVQKRMRYLGIPKEMIGSSDQKHGVERRAFFPHESDGGGVAPGGRISVDSGILNPELHPLKEWANATLRFAGSTRQSPMNMRRPEGTPTGTLAVEYAL